jgi:arylsulfatase A-like enzyme/Flp pilus assembly protein TadD
MKRASLLLALVAIAGCGGGDRPGKPWNVLIVTFDTTRADVLGCYGNPRQPSPHIDRIAREGALFENAFTAIPITTPSHSTIFTGLYPTAHGVRDNGRFKLAEGQRTLAETLHGAGWRTAAAVGAFPLTRDWGLAQGFDFYDDEVRVADQDQRGRPAGPQKMFFDERPATRVNDAALTWLRDRDPGPFFLWVHYWDPHQPLDAPRAFSQLFPQNPYEAEVAFADSAFGAILAELERTGEYERTLIVVVADHGEGHGEHGEDTHSMLLYNATLHVPLVIRAPGGAPGRRIRERVGTVDITPTVLDVLGIPPPVAMHGRSLAGQLSRPESGTDASLPSDRRPYYAESLSPRLSYGWGELRALFLGRSKLIYGPQVELYDLVSDPRELADQGHGELAEEMTGRLDRFLKEHASAAAADAATTADREAIERLAALGYLSASAGPVEVVEKLRREGVPPRERVAGVSRWSRCKVAIEKRDFLAARELALPLFQEAPENPFYVALLASAYIGLEQLDEAAALATPSAIGRANDEVFLSVAHALFSRGRDAEGLALADRIVAASPSAGAHYLRGEMRGALGQAEGREADLRKAVELDAAHDRARQSLAVLLAESGRPEEAEPHLRELVARRPLDPSAHFNLGNFLLASGRATEADVPISRALELEPRHWNAQLARLEILIRSGRAAEARGLAERLVREAPDPRIVARARALAEAPE